jgi:hypothetical protein
MCFLKKGTRIEFFKVRNKIISFDDILSIYSSETVKTQSGIFQ